MTNPDSLRIALIAPPWLPIPPDGYGGIEVIVDWLARGYAESGHEVVLFSAGPSCTPVPHVAVLDAPESLRMNEVIPALRYAHLAAQAVREHGPFDIVHDHTLAGPLAGEVGLPTVVTAHEPMNSDLAPIYAEMAARGASVVCISHRQRESAPDVPVRTVIHHGVDTVSHSYGAGDGGYLLSLGRFAPEKGVHLAIDAARAAGMALTIAARSPKKDETHYFEREILPRIGDGVDYVGEVGHSAKISLLQNARALLMPITWHEPFGMVMIEALSCGTPVIAFRKGAAPEIVRDGETGFLCDTIEETVDAIAAIDKIDRRACRSAVEEKFSREAMTSAYLSLFAELGSTIDVRLAPSVKGVDLR